MRNEMSRRRPTPEELEKLSRIVNRRQREALLRAIERGEEIPDFAWHPVPDLPEDAQRKLDELLEPLVRDLVGLALAGVDVEGFMSEIARRADAEEDEPCERVDPGPPTSEGRVTFDPDFRPATYWPREPDVAVRLSRIKGSVRRKSAEEALHEQGSEALAEHPQLFTESLDEETRRRWGALHPWDTEGEFLPDLDEGEVEIARIELASVTADVISFRARPHGAGMRYRVVDEYDLDTVLLERNSLEPLTAGELIELIDGTGIIDEVLALNFEDAPDEAAGFVTVSSAFYPRLSDYYEEWVATWISQRREG